MAPYKKNGTTNTKAYPTERKKLLSPLCPLNYIEVDYKIDLLQEIKKKRYRPSSNKTSSIRNNPYLIP
jgi:hypothetical protein